MKFECFLCEEEFPLDHPLYKLTIETSEGPIHRLMCKTCGKTALVHREMEVAQNGSDGNTV